ncbi:MAG: hemolysin III family protein [Balneolaceae bacterium]
MIKKIKKTDRKQTAGEEIANSISHGIGLIGAIIAAPFLIMHAATNGDALTVIGVCVFITTAIILYFSSTIYHAAKQDELKQRLRIFDHMAIFLLIAGTYTPFTLGVLRDSIGWIMFGLIWGIAIGGIILKLLVGVKYPKFSTFLYLAMGWIALFAAKDMWLSMPPAGIIWLMLGGLAYTIGVAFYAAPKLKYTHFIWHLFVLIGTTCHFFAIFWYSV